MPHKQVEDTSQLQKHKSSVNGNHTDQKNNKSQRNQEVSGNMQSSETDSKQNILANMDGENAEVDVGFVSRGDEEENLTTKKTQKNIEETMSKLKNLKDEYRKKYNQKNFQNADDTGKKK